MVDPRRVTTAFELPGCRLVRNLGVVRGLVVRSRSIVGNIGASFQTLFGSFSITLGRRVKARSVVRQGVGRASRLGPCSPAFR